MMKTAFVYSIVKRWSFILGLVFIVVMNYLSTALPFGGMSNADISAAYPTLITPSGYAFAIWGVIYSALIVFAYFQLMKGSNVRFFKLIWPYFMINALANGLWLLAFQNEWFGVSVIIMGVLLGTLIAIFRLFYRLKDALGTTHRFFFHVPFGIYFGWVCVASIVNVAVLLTAYDLQFFTDAPELWSLIMLSAGFLIAMALLIVHKDYIVALTFVWAYVAIMLAHMDVDMVRYPAKLGAIVLATTSIVLFVADRLKVGQYGRSNM